MCYNVNEYLKSLRKYWTESAEKAESGTTDESYLTEYIKNDSQICCALSAEITKSTINNKPEIEKVIFNKPATIVIWKDKTKTVVKCGENDVYDPEKGLAMCYVKKILGNKGNYYNTFKKWLPKEE